MRPCLRLGHDVRRVGGGACLAIAGASVVVVDAVRAATLRNEPGLRVYVVHPAGHVGPMWDSFRAGATPCALRSDRRRPLPLPLGADARNGALLAVDALHHEIVGRHADACETVARVPTDRARDAVDTLVDAGAAALDRLRTRARYPVPTYVLVDQLPEHVGTFDDEAFELWWRMVETIAFRASGLDLPPAVATRPGPSRLFGAFHAAATIVQFTARRHWRRPVELLGDLASSS